MNSPSSPSGYSILVFVSQVSVVVICSPSKIVMVVVMVIGGLDSVVEPSGRGSRPSSSIAFKDFFSSVVEQSSYSTFLGRAGTHS